MHVKLTCHKFHSEDFHTKVMDPRVNLVVNIRTTPVNIIRDLEPFDLPKHNKRCVELISCTKFSHQVGSLAIRRLFQVYS